MRPFQWKGKEDRGGKKQIASHSIPLSDNGKKKNVCSLPLVKDSFRRARRKKTSHVHEKWRHERSDQLMSTALLLLSTMSMQSENKNHIKQFQRVYFSLSPIKSKRGFFLLFFFFLSICSPSFLSLVCKGNWTTAWWDNRKLLNAFDRMMPHHFLAFRMRSKSERGQWPVESIFSRKLDLISSLSRLLSCRRMSIELIRGIPSQAKIRLSRSAFVCWSYVSIKCK